MRRLTGRLAGAITAALLTIPLYEGCTIVLPPLDGYVIDLSNGIPHLDGDGEDSFLDRFFGFDDDDD